METDDDKDRRRKYIAELVARGGVQIDPDDPSFELIILNRLILEDQKNEIENLFDRFLSSESKLTEEIEALPRALESAISPTIGGLKDAMTELEEYREGAIQDLKAKAAYYIEAELNGIRQSVRKVLAEEGKGILHDVAAALKVAAEAQQRAVEAKRGREWKFFVAIGLVGILGGTMGALGSFVWHDSKLAEEAAFGRAVGSVWHDLPKAIKERVQVAREKE